MTIATQLEFGHSIPAGNGLHFLLDLRMTLDALYRHMFTFEREAGEGMIERLRGALIPRTCRMTTLTRLHEFSVVGIEVTG